MAPRPSRAALWLLVTLVTLAGPRAVCEAYTVTRFADTFTETSDTALTAHTPNTGTSWTEVFDSSSAGTNAEVIGASDTVAGGSSQNNVGQAYTAAPAPATADQNVSMTISTLETDSGTKPWGLFGRRTDNNNFYHVEILPNTNAASSVKLFKFVGGSATELGAYDATLAVGTVIKLELTNATKKVFVNSVERISSTDNALTAAGTWGLYFGSFNGAGSDGHLRPTWRLDDFSGEEIRRRVVLIE